MSEEIDGTSGERDFAKEYSRDGLLAKIKTVAKWIGEELLLLVLTLYYCLEDPDTPMAMKSTIVTALGYFILPLDTIPDPVPGVGYTDDLGVLVLALRLVVQHVKPEHRQRAKEKVRELLG